MYLSLELQVLMAELKTNPVGLVYIGVKRSNKLVITKNIFKQKTRSSIQKASVKRALDIVSSLI